MALPILLLLGILPFAPLVSLPAAQPAAAFNLDAGIAAVCQAQDKPLRRDSESLYGDTHWVKFRCGDGPVIEITTEPAEGEPRLVTAKVRGVPADAVQRSARFVAEACVAQMLPLAETENHRSFACERADGRMFVSLTRAGDDLFFAAAELPR